MIISRTPHRISFFGGGTDYPSYYMENGGRVLGVTINKYSYLNVRKLPPFFEHKHRIVYSRSENVSSIDEIEHPAVRAVLKYLNIDYGVSIHHDGDIPARSGMGSSSAFTVGMLKSMLALEGKHIDCETLAKTAIHIEQDLIGENVGSQDQIFSAFGGLDSIEFLPGGQFNVEPVVLRPGRARELENSLIMIYTGISRIASEIAAEQIRNTDNNRSRLKAMRQLTDEAFNILVSERPLVEFGKLLHESWQLKRSLSSKIATSAIDEIYARAIGSGAVGGKLLGAGGGGFMLFFVPPEKQKAVREGLDGLLEVPFRFEYDGSKLIVYQPEQQD